MLAMVLICSVSNSYCQEQICYKKIKVYKLDATGTYLNVFKHNKDLIFRIDRNGVVEDQIIFTNVELPDSSLINFTARDNNKAYALEMGVFGSTFGANNFLIIWKDGYWNLSKTPFIKSEIVSKGKSGFSEFKIYYSNKKNSSNRYEFLDGLFLPVKD